MPASFSISVARSQRAGDGPADGLVLVHWPVPGTLVAPIGARIDSMTPSFNHDTDARITRRIFSLRLVASNPGKSQEVLVMINSL